MNKLTEWLELMLAEINRKRDDAAAGAAEQARREAVPAQPAPPPAPSPSGGQ
jgi:hypothetical protein